MLDSYIGNEKYNYLELKNGTKIHKTSIVEPWVKFEDGCIVRPYAIVGRLPENSPSFARQPIRKEEVIIGKGTKIGCFAIVFSDVVLGEDCFIGDHSLIREGGRLGDRCMIGCHVSISYNCKIGSRSRFQNGSVFHGECGEDCFFGVGIVCSSDKKIDLNNYHHKISTPPIFGNKVMVGSGANILPGVLVGDGAIIGAGAIVTKNIEANYLVLGEAAKKISHIQV